METDPETNTNVVGAKIGVVYATVKNAKIY